MPDGVRASFEGLFRAPLSTVRIHDDAGAARLARRHAANALAVGEDVYFARGRYRPGDAAGRRLLAHEITHALQQRRPRTSGSASAAETEAHALAERGLSAATLPAVGQATPAEPLRLKSQAREVLEDELDDVFCNVANAWPHIRRASQAERDDLRNDKDIERKVRRRASEKKLLKTYLLLRYQTEESFPAHFQAFIEATDKLGTDEARIYALLRGVTQRERAEMQQTPGVVEVLKDEMSGAELRLALRLLSGREERAGTGTSSGKYGGLPLRSEHLEVGQRYLLNVGARGSFEDVRASLQEAVTFGKENRQGLLGDTSLWAQFADEFDAEEVWYLRMIARYKAPDKFPKAGGQPVSFIQTIWNSVEGLGTDEKKLIDELQAVNRATGLSGGAGWPMKSPPRDELKDDPWFVPMLKSELSGRDLERALNAVSAQPSTAAGIRDDLRKAIDKRDMGKIRSLLTTPGPAAATARASLRNDPVILDEMGEELKGPDLCETTQLLAHGRVAPLVNPLLDALRKKPIDVKGAETYLKNLNKANQDKLLHEPGVYFMLSNSDLPYDDMARLLASIRSKDPKWQEPGSEGVYFKYPEEAVRVTLPVSFTSNEARLQVRMKLDTRVDSGTIEKWTRTIDTIWNRRFHVRTLAVGNRDTWLALVFNAYFGVGIAPPAFRVVIQQGKGRASVQYPPSGPEMHLFEESEPLTVAHEFGHLVGNPDQYRLTRKSYSEFTKMTLSSVPRGGKTVPGVMGRQFESTAIEERNVWPGLEIINEARDRAVYPHRFMLEWD